MKDRRDADLGMDRPITRRDFLNGMALVVGGSLVPTSLLYASEFASEPEKAPDYYPPLLTGIANADAAAYAYADAAVDQAYRAVQELLPRG